MGDLAVDTAVEGGDGRYRAALSRDWEIWGPNGGYVAAIALRAAGAESRFARPASLMGHFLSSARFEDVELAVDVIRATRVADSLRVSMTQGDRPVFEALVWVVDDVDGLAHDAAPAPEGVPAPLDVRTFEERLGDDARPLFVFWDNLEQRPLSWIDDWEGREPSEPVARSWFRYRPTPTFDDPFVDAARSLLLVDTMGWPAAVRAHAEPVGMIAPNIDLAVRFHRLEPASQFLFVEATAPVAADGLIGASTRVWSESGRLLASGGEQLLCRPFTRDAPTR